MIQSNEKICKSCSWPQKTTNWDLFYQQDQTTLYRKAIEVLLKHNNLREVLQALIKVIKPKTEDEKKAIRSLLEDAFKNDTI